METRRYLLLAAFLLFAVNANAEPLTGVLHVFDAPEPDYCEIMCDDVTGDYDASAGTLSFDPVSNFFGGDLTASSVILLSEGTHNLSNGYGDIYTVTVGPGQVGAYMTLTWSFAPFQTGFVVMVWEVTGPLTSQVFTPVDSDGDGIPGHATTGGFLFAGLTFIFEFVVGAPPPDVEITLDVTGGTFHECASADGTTVEITATVTLSGGAELDSINWVVDGEPAGSGTVISPTLVGLSSHTISATALTTTGESDFDVVAVLIIDSTPPALDVAFLDSRSGEPVTQIDRANVDWILAHFVATDVCDPDPVTSGVGGFAVENHDLLKVQGNNNTVMMTTSELVLKATATDSRGNSGEGSATLVITD